MRIFRKKKRVEGDARKIVPNRVGVDGKNRQPIKLGFQLLENLSQLKTRGAQSAGR
jgi:hypothetical protein